MKFGIFFEFSVPRPFSPEGMRRVYDHSLEQVKLVPYDRAWATTNKDRILKKWQAVVS